MKNINEGGESPIPEVGGEEEVVKGQESATTLATLLGGVGQRPEPWMKVLPVRAVVLTTYSALAFSSDMQPGQLIPLANKLLSFVVELEHQASQGGSRDMFIKKYLEILDGLFARLTSISLENQDQTDFDTLVETLWTSYTSGSVKLEGTSIPEKLVTQRPSRLEQVMGTTTSSSSTSLEALNSTLSLETILPLCLGSSSNFMKVMELLHTRFISSPSTLPFCGLLLSTLHKQLGETFLTTFPTPFHPFIAFITSFRPGHLKRLLTNSLISDELVNLLDFLYFHCQSQGIHLPTVSFILLALPHLPQTFIQTTTTKNLAYKKSPHLKKAMRDPDINLFNSHPIPISIK